MSAIMTAAKLFGTEGAKKLAGDMVSFLEKGLPRVYTDVTGKKEIDSGDAYEEYIKKVYVTYSKSKTIIYRNEEKELSSFFEPPFLRKEETHFNRTPEEVMIPSENIKQIFEQGGHSKILITGIGGMGKTILLKHLCVNSIVTNFKIPIFVPLRWFNNEDLQGNRLEKLIYERLEINGFQLPYEYFRYSLAGGKYVFLFDAYDEISEENRSVLTKKLSDFTKHYSNNYFVITSRPVDQVYGLDAYTIFKLCRMEIDQVERLILKLEFDAITKKKFVNELKTSLYDKYASFASIPLTLSVLYLTYVQNATIPETLQEFYESAFDTLLYRHDTWKEGYERVLKSKIGRHEFKEIFIQFCFRTYFKYEYSFSEALLIDRIFEAMRKVDKSVGVHAYKDDLVNVTCMLIRDGREYIFLHRSFQEYFAAYYVSRMIEERQKEFCAAFFADHNFSKTRDFLKMLQSIEPNRYAKVVLMPILEKIHRQYLKNDCDLIRTAAQLYIVVVSKELSEEDMYNLYFGSTEFDEGIESISRAEFIALYDVHNGVRVCLPDFVTAQFMKENFDRICRKFRVFNKARDARKVTLESQKIVVVGKNWSIEQCFITAFSQVYMFLKKYDELVECNFQKMTFTQMLDQF